MTDLAQYMEIFVAESRELIETLNLSLVALERDPSDGATIDEIFRVAHSIKGIASTMGFELMSALTHEMEHLLDMVRLGRVAIDADVVTLLLQGLDLLEHAVDSIEQTGVEDIDPAPVVQRLQQLDPTDGDRATPAAAALRSVDLPPLDAFPPGIELLHVRVQVDAACDSASMRVFMAYTAVERECEPLWSNPGPEELDTIEVASLDVIVPAETAELAQQLAQALARVPELADVTIAAWTGQQPAAPPPAEPLPAEPLPAEPSTVETPAPTVAGRDAVRTRRSGTVRIDADRLDTLMHLMGEVVVHRSAVETRLRDRDIDAAIVAAQDLRRSTQALQAEVMNVRMVPVETAFMRMPRLVRDLSAKLGKDVRLVIEGADTEIDRSVVDALGEPLVHLVRNALDHGIEPPDLRVDAGKPATATLTIRAEHAGGSVLISVLDDGRGVDPERVKARAVERGILTPAEAAALDDQGAIDLVFRPGFSTAEVATDVSGRGVGMDAVRAMCREWGGDVDMRSTTGAGAVATIRIPLTLAVMNVLVVELGTRVVAIPIERIERTIRLGDHVRAEPLPGRRFVRFDEAVVSEVDLGAAVGYGAQHDAAFGVVVRGGAGREVVLAVSGLVGEYEAVTKPLPRATANDGIFIGAAIQGDGSVVLIVDCDEITDARQTQHDGRTIAQEAAPDHLDPVRTGNGRALQ